MEKFRSVSNQIAFPPGEKTESINRTTANGAIKYDASRPNQKVLSKSTDFINSIGSKNSVLQSHTTRSLCGTILVDQNKAIDTTSTETVTDVFMGGDCFSQETCSSGPFSLIGIEKCHSSSILNDSVDEESTEVVTIPDQDLVINSESVNKKLGNVCTDVTKCKPERRDTRFIPSLFHRYHTVESDSTQGFTRYSSSQENSTCSNKERHKRKSAQDSSNNLYTSSLLSTNITPEIFGNANKKLATPINSPVETLEEESLGILTPNQMKEFPQFIDSSKTPSSDDLKSLISSKISDKTISNSRTPSSENLGSLPHDGFKIPLPVNNGMELPVQNIELTRPDSIELKQPLNTPTKVCKTAELSSPSFVDQSTLDFSLGLIDEDMLASTTFSSNLEKTANMDLLLDPVNLDETLEDLKKIPRCDQTPSPEDLPLDPIDPKMELLEPGSSNSCIESDTKTDSSSKSAPNTKTNSFITSITSITSLDTGYQGDGEMSRPASRGADHSPIAHKPNIPAAVNLHRHRAVTRRQDPMTDSDFFTESDLDGHDEAGFRGDRMAQVIDGTLYGVHVQAAPGAANIYINNHEEMDSSGIFTDLDPRTDDFSDGERNKDVIKVIDDKSPSDVSTKSISENSQELKILTVDVTLTNETKMVEPLQEKMENTVEEKVKSPIQSLASTPNSRKNTRTRTSLPKDERPNKKLKMPKRNVVSKVKTMMESSKSVDSENQENRKPSRKTVNRWDAVMNKISKGQDDQKSKLRLTQVKSKIACGITGHPTNKRNENNKSEEATKPKMYVFYLIPIN